MRHRKRTVKLGRTSAHRDALLSGLVCNLIVARRIKTTLPKAKAARSLAEKMVTLGKKGDLPAKRKAISKLHRKDAVRTLFNDIAPGFQSRQGGYTRILKLGRRSSDSSEMALLEWVNYSLPDGDDAPAATTSAPAAEREESKPAPDVQDAEVVETTILFDALAPGAGIDPERISELLAERVQGARGLTVLRSDGET
ncbi:MAG: 50S ribosomal protein L17, partial [Verrucomicrobiota bacterium]